MVKYQTGSNNKSVPKLITKLGSGDKPHRATTSPITNAKIKISRIELTIPHNTSPGVQGIAGEGIRFGWSSKER
jgi:hypothetical protein